MAKPGSVWSGPTGPFDTDAFTWMGTVDDLVRRVCELEDALRALVGITRTIEQDGILVARAVIADQQAKASPVHRHRGRGYPGG
jgi:hypothetical protein